jgi:hypothetical protein
MTSNSLRNAPSDDQRAVHTLHALLNAKCVAEFLARTTKRDASTAGADQDREIASRRHIVFAFRGLVRRALRRRKQLEYSVGNDLLESPLLPLRRPRCDALVRDECRIRSLERALSASVKPPLDEVTRRSRFSAFQFLIWRPNWASPPEAKKPVSGLTARRPSAVVSKRYSGFFPASAISISSVTRSVRAMTTGSKASRRRAAESASPIAFLYTIRARELTVQHFSCVRTRTFAYITPACRIRRRGVCTSYEQEPSSKKVANQTKSRLAEAPRQLPQASILART